jgi:hypothetical protein
MSKHKGVKEGWTGMNFEKSIHFDKKEDRKPSEVTSNMRKDFKSEQTGKKFETTTINSKIENIASVDLGYDVDASAIKTIDDIVLILEFMELKFKPKDKESFEKIKHLLKK